MPRMETGVLVIAGALLLVLGAALMLWGIRWDPARGRLRCPKCWYPLEHLPELRCPECGHRPPDVRCCRRCRRHMGVIAIGLAITALVPTGYMVERRLRSALTPLLPKWELVDEVRTGRTLVRLYKDRVDDEPMEVRVYFDGTLLFLRDDGMLEVGAMSSPEDCRVEHIRRHAFDDINGDGIPDLVVKGYSLGAHCCFTTWILALDSQSGPKLLAQIETQHGEAEFVDLDGDGALEIRFSDWTFAYWNVSFTESPAPSVVLRFQDGAYVVAPELMRTPPPSPSEFRDMVDTVRREFSTSRDESPPRDVPAAYWSAILDLLYGGHADMAWKFAAEAWPDDIEGREAFMADFTDQLETSWCWRQFESGLQGSNNP